MTTLRAAPLALLLVLTACGSLTDKLDPSAHRHFPPAVVPPLADGAAHERFIAFGDWGTGHRDQERVAQAMAVWARRDGLAFMLTAGDNFYQRGVESAEDPRWGDAFEDVYDDPALARAPVYPTLGNHDHKGDPDAQVAYSRMNPRWVMPARHYTVRRVLSDGTEVQLFAIDTMPIREGWAGHEEQLAWLDRALGASTARWKLVFGHHPLYTHSGRGQDDAMIRQLEPLLVEHGVDVYFAGHDHILELLQPRRGVQYVVTGAGAGPHKMGRVAWAEDTLYAASGGGFVGGRVSRDELVLEFVRLEGRPQFVHVLRKPPPAGAASGPGASTPVEAPARAGD